MKPFPKIHDLYVARVLLGTVLLTWVVLIGLDAVMAVVAELNDVGTGHYGFGSAVAVVALSIPRRAYMLFPTAAVIGALMGLGQLAASSELTALRALGLSRRRLSIAVAGALVALTALMVVNGETLGPWGQRRADSLKASAKSNDMIVAQYSGLWAREGDTFLNAQTGQERGNGSKRYLELQGVRLYEFAKDGRLESIARAASAEHHPGGWLLHNVRRTWFDSRSVNETEALEEHWASKLDETALAASIASPRYLPATELSRGIAYRKRNGLDASEYEEHYWGRWFYPLNVLALCLAAVPFAFGSLRSGGLGKRLFIGIVFALGFWLVQTQFVKLAGVYKFDYRLAYLIPPAIMLGVSATLFRRRSG
ncbi:LPS export ABC transporter permease LptG [Pseudoluteimonas lycopersici]|uniref:LPS export ABC transporter permease LptG n=1 Tax=Pseudoluteimonas lycopersici TaxID=1324796 RepID=A0A516V7D7_9GAMM|nr:LPS export ABC transporter permease LptG [Lysobacter lycopersici]QDQ74456.1 LPS export ABC transporter permease LptG [Lysobacter lycopersici]